MSNISPSDLIKLTICRLIEVSSSKKGSPLPEDDVKKIEEIVMDAFKSLTELVQLQKTLIAKLEFANQELLERINEISAAHHLLNNRADSVENQHAKLQKDFDNLRAKNLLSETEHTSLLKESEALKKEKLELETKYQDLKKQCDGLTSENKKLIDKSNQLDGQASKLTDNYTKLEEVNCQLKQESEGLKKQYDQLESQHGNLKTETKNWSVKYSGLNERYEKLKKVAEEAINKNSFAAKYCEFFDKYETELTILSCVNPIILVETIMYGIKKR